MQLATAATLADEVVDQLNGHEFSLPFTAERMYLPRFDLTEMDELHVTVVARSVTDELADRSRTRHDHTIDVAVQQKLATLDNDEIDPLVALVEEIAEFFRKLRMGEAICVKTEIQPLCSPEHLHEMRQFTSIVTLTLRVFR